MSAYPLRDLGLCACGKPKIRRHASARYCADCSLERRRAFQSRLQRRYRQKMTAAQRERHRAQAKAWRLTETKAEREALLRAWGFA